MTDIQALLADLKAADVGNRELGDRVLLALPEWRYEADTGWWLHNEAYTSAERPNPTLSVDAGLALVPEGWHFDLRKEIFYRISDIPGMSACIWAEDAVKLMLESPELGQQPVESGYHPTSLPLALSIALVEAKRQLND